MQLQLCRHRGKPAPETLHVVTENSSRRLDELGRINQMRRAAGMHINFCVQFPEPPCRAGVIEMNVTQENVTEVLGLEAGFSKIDNHIVKSRFRTGVEKREAIVGCERGRGDNSRVAKLSRIENMDFHAPLTLKLRRCRQLSE